MTVQNSMLRRAGVAAAAGLLAVLAVPVSATAAPTPTHESYSISGVMAEAGWSAGEEGQEPDAPVGVPRVLYLSGADATSVHRVPGTRPERMPQPALLAIGLTMPGVEAGDEPYPAELWCSTGDFTFTAAGDLSSAELNVPTCEAMVVVFDEKTGEEAPNGVTVTLAVTSTWTATGPLESVKSHSRYTNGDLWTMDTNRASMRQATADLTVTGLPGGTFVATTQEASIQDVKSGTLIHQ